MEIAYHVYDLRQRAKTLKEEGKRLLDETKQEVERMILSEKQNRNEHKAQECLKTDADWSNE